MLPWQDELNPRVRCAFGNVIVNMLPCSGVGNALPQGRHVEADGHHLQEGRTSGRVLQEGAQVRDG